MERDSQTKRRSFKQTLCVYSLKAIVLIALGVLFHIFSSGESHYESDCVFLLKWARVYTFLCIICGGLILILVIGGFLTCNANFISQLADLIYSIFLLIGFIVWILMVYGLFKKEPCGHLRILVIICILICIASYVIEFILFVFCAPQQVMDERRSRSTH